TFTYEETYIDGSSTTKSSANGDVEGVLMIIDDPAAQNLFGFGYSAEGFVHATMTYIYTGPNGTTTSSGPATIVWLPNVTGFPGAGGSIEGVRNTTSPGATSSTETTTYKFAVPPPK
ncbi:MAG TPA: hypothetical protein VJL08_00030, partial [Dehalococcoidia bacterium]|nr:hypothetical protein [Dehalococcoidia bacterium]